MNNLTTIILTKNSADTLKKALDSAAFSHQILVIDDYSTDQTLKIAKQAQASILQRHLKGDYSAQRNFALSKVKTQWALFLDSDETIPQALKNQIQTAIQNQHVQGYYLKRQDKFLGKTLKHGETGHIKLLRLAQKSAGKWHRPVHEVWHISGPNQTLSTPLIHTPHLNLDQFLDKINTYTTIEATHRSSQHQKLNLLQLLLYPPAKFIQNYFFKLGFLDGYPGLIQAFFMSLHSLTVRIKQYEQTNPNQKGL